MFKFFEDAALKRLNQIAISNEISVLTYGDLLQKAEAFRQLFTNTEHPMKVLIALPSGPEFTAVQLGTFGAAAKAIPIPFKTTENEAKSYLQLISPDLIVVQSLKASANIITVLKDPITILTIEDSDHHTLPHRILKWHEVTAKPDVIEKIQTRYKNLPVETRMIQFTSGSTGLPKGILISNDNFLANLNANKEHLAHFTGKHVFCPIPQFHAMGNAVVWEHLCYGSPIHLANSFFYGEHLKKMRYYACSSILASPNYFKLLLKNGVLKPSNLPTLESVTVGTATVDQSLVEDFHKVFPDLTIHCRYGLSESVGAMARLTLGPSEELSSPGLVGPPVPGAELAPGLPSLKQEEPSEIKVKYDANAVGQLTINGQWASLLDINGYLHTGDLAYLDDSGFLHLRGRITTFLKCNGYRINPFEIETVLREIKGIQEAVVIGVPDPISEQRIVACLEPSPNETIPNQLKLLTICKDCLSPYKIPQQFITFEKIPRNQAGKPDRPAILNAITTYFNQ